MGWFETAIIADALLLLVVRVRTLRVNEYHEGGANRVRIHFAAATYLRNNV